MLETRNLSGSGWHVECVEKLEHGMISGCDLRVIDSHFIGHLSENRVYAKKTLKVETHDDHDNAMGFWAPIF